MNFWDRIAKRYAKKPVSDETTYQKKLAVTQSYLKSDTKVLEFGCGTGSTALVLAPHVNDYEAIDVSANMIAIARDKLAETAIDNLTFKQAALEEYPAHDSSLDAVLGHSILHLLNDPDDAIRRVYRMLKPGGIFVSSTACIGDGMRFFRLIAPLGKWLRLIPMVKVFSRKDLETSLQAAGFRIDYSLVPENSPMSVFLIAVKPHEDP
ncbi:MAG: class I SAM-dependent methyltransferase [Motiliproteus sp.]